MSMKTKVCLLFLHIISSNVKSLAFIPLSGKWVSPIRLKHRRFQTLPLADILSVSFSLVFAISSDLKKKYMILECSASL